MNFLRRFILLSFSFAVVSISASAGNTWYVAPNGSDQNVGTIDSPFATIMHAQVTAEPGDTVYIRGGTYHYDNSDITTTLATGPRALVNWMYKNNIQYLAYPGERPVLDFSNVRPQGARVAAFYVTADDCVFKGFDTVGVQVTVTAQQASNTQSYNFRVVGGNRNRFENLVMRDGMGIGWFLASGSDNLVLNCDAYNNVGLDSASIGNVDGFGAHPGAGDTGNRFVGCRAWFNSDDGFDLISSNEVVVIENCWAFYNGYDRDFNPLADGLGFKAGGYGRNGSSYPVPTPRHQVINCLAVGNKTAGFYANHHPGGLDWIHNTAIRNPVNFNMLNTLEDNLTNVPGYDHYMRNNLSFLGGVTNLNEAESDVAGNSFTLGINVTANDFMSLDESQLMAPRKPNGDLPDITFAQLRSDSQLIDAGEDIGRPFNGTAPDLGAFEYGDVEFTFEYKIHEIEADADTWIQVEFTIGDEPDTEILSATHGSSDLMIIRSSDHTALGMTVREYISYVRFDLSGIGGEVADGALFELTATGGSDSWSSSQVHLYGLVPGEGHTSQNWDESVLNWETVGEEVFLELIGNNYVGMDEARISGPFLLNAPASGTLDLVEGGRLVPFSSPQLSEFVADRLADNGLVTFIVVNRPNANRGIDFASREHSNPDWHPRLTIQTIEYKAHEEWAGLQPDPFGDVLSESTLGWINVKDSPWIWSYSLGSYIYLEENRYANPSTLFYVPNLSGELYVGEWDTKFLNAEGNLFADCFLGWVNAINAPWVWSYSLSKYLYIPEAAATDAGAWVWLP